jgi:hypothetical protein
MSVGASNALDEALAHDDAFTRMTLRTLPSVPLGYRFRCLFKFEETTVCSMAA